MNVPNEVLDKGIEGCLEDAFDQDGRCPEDPFDQEGSALEDTPVCNRGIRERAPGKGAMDSDITTHSPSKTQIGGKPKRAPPQGVKVSDIPAGISGKHSMEGKRERAPAQGVKVSDIPVGILGKRAGAREGGEGTGRPRWNFGYIPHQWETRAGVREGGERFV